MIISISFTGGVTVKELKEKHGLSEKELEIFLPISANELTQKELMYII